MNLSNIFGKKPTPKLPTDADKVSISKLMAALTLLQQAYGLKIFFSPEYKNHLAHDLAIKLANGDLKGIALEIMDAQEVIVFTQTWNFPVEADPNFAKNLVTLGQEIPIISPARVVSSRLVVHSRALEANYKGLLKLNYETAANKAKAAASKFDTAYSCKTGGRQSSDLALAEHFRETLIITRPVGNKGFGFATCPRLQLEGILLHRRYFLNASAANLGWGKQVSACLVQTKHRIQARSIQPAT